MEDSGVSGVRPSPMAKSENTTVAAYLLHRLKEIGVGHLFGVPGDFVLGFLNQVLKSEVEYIGTCNELNAAYAADGYARIRGTGAMVSTFGVGELSALNGVAGAFAERIGVVVITGAPATNDFTARSLLHHTLGDYDIPLRMFEAVTVAHALLDSEATAASEIDRVLTACLVFHQPVYLRLPSDMVDKPCPWPKRFVFPVPVPSDPAALQEAVSEAVERLSRARHPLVIVGVALNRFGIQGEFSALLEKTGFPFVTQMLAKAVLSEHHPQFLGIYEGNQSRQAVLEAVHLADMVLQLGSGMTDYNTGGFTTRSDPDSWILADLRSVKIAHHVYEEVNLLDFLVSVTASLRPRDPKTMKLIPASESCRHRSTQAFTPRLSAPLTVERLFDRMSHFLDTQTVVLAEMGVSLFCAAETLLPQGASFIGQTFYGSIGYTLGATLGACLAAEGRQVVLFIGDGAFQVTGQDLSTLIRYGLKPVVVLLNNDGYTIERVICDGRYNDIQPWNYAALPETFGGLPGTVVSTEEELEAALTTKRPSGLFFLEARTGRWDCPENLRNMGQSMARSNHLKVNQ